MDKPAWLAGKYVNLETFRRNGSGVKTPVWFVHHNDKILIVTGRNTGKVLRLASNPRVRLAPCSATGKIRGEWVSGTASRLGPEEEREALALRRKKYGIKAALAGLVIRARGGLAAYSVEL